MARVKYTCLETCGQEKNCGNKFCSAHPRYSKFRSNEQFRKGKHQKNKFHPLGY